MAKELKISMAPPPGQQTYAQHTYKVDDTFQFDVLEGEQWFQFEDTDEVAYAFPMHRIVALAVRQL